MTSKPNLRETDMAKRGRPTKAESELRAIIKDRDATINALEIELDLERRGVGDRYLQDQLAKERDHHMNHAAKLAEELKSAEGRIEKARAEFEDLNKACRELEEDCKRADKKSAELAEEWQEAQKLSEDRFLSNQALAKQLVQAEDRIKDLLAEIRMYEHEHMTLRQIIIDGLRRDD